MPGNHDNSSSRNFCNRRYNLEAYADTEVFRHWLAQMEEHLPLRISMTVHVFSVCFVFEVLTEEFMYRLFLRRLR